MSLFNFFRKKKVDLTEDQRKWNKMWELWAEEQADAPYAQLMTYQSEINNGGHDQYFTNAENVADVQNEMSTLENILPAIHKDNLQKAYKAYLVLKEKEDEHAEETLEQCDNVFYENEAVLNELLEKYAKTIEL